MKIKKFTCQGAVGLFRLHELEYIVLFVLTCCIFLTVWDSM